MEGWDNGGGERIGGGQRETQRMRPTGGSGRRERQREWEREGKSLGLRGEGLGVRGERLGVKR